MKNSTLLTDLDEYLAYKKLYLRDSSYKVYRLFGDNLSDFIRKNELDNLQPSHVTPTICESYKKYILAKYSNSVTRNKEILQMKCFFKYFLNPSRERYIKSPATFIEFVPKQESEMHEPYTQKQVAEIFGKIIEQRDYYLLLYIYFIHYTFARPGREVRLLKVGDLKPRSVFIKPENSKNRKLKTPTITKPLEELIDYLGIRNLPRHYYIFGKHGSPGTVVCGQNMYYHRHTLILKELKIVGAKYTLYGWKHTGNIRAIELGIKEREIQFQNGFQDHKTLEIYVRRLSAYMSTEIYDKFN